MNYILFDDSEVENLLPITFTRPVCEIRVGIWTLRQKWEYFTAQNCSFLTRDYLSAKYKLVIDEDNTFINGAIFPSIDLFQEIKALNINELLFENNILIAARIADNSISEINFQNFNQNEINKNKYKIIETSIAFKKLKHVWEIFADNGREIESDYKLIKGNRASAPISKTNTVFAPENIFIEEGARVECAILNAEGGHIYIGKDSEIMEGSIVRGPFALCEHATLKMGAKIYGQTTIGPHSKVGGEVSNSVIIGYSNKGHDGFLGNSVLGEWCNIGADSNNSNLKNNYANVRLWNYITESFVDTGLQFCGLIMGDHSKCGINTMFNTGTVVGVNANIYGTGFPRNFVPSFSWGGASGFSTYKIEKAFEVAELVFARRGMTFDDTEKQILSKVFELTSKYRIR